MTTAQTLRAQFLAEIARLHRRFTSAARAFERDDHPTVEAEISALTQELKTLVGDHLKAYPQVLQNDRLEFLKKSDSVSKTKAAGLLKNLIELEKSLHLMEKEIRRSYPNESSFKNLWIRRKWLLTGSGAALLLLVGAGFLMTPRHGLKGDYYDGTEFQKLVKTRLDRTVEFDWGFAGPFDLEDHFSIRWTGSLLVPSDGTYEFVTRSDDGVRLYINNKLIIDQWNLHALQTDRATVTLQKGPCPIRFEYFEYARAAQVQLRWRPDIDGDDQPIPAEFLSPDMPAPAKP